MRTVPGVEAVAIASRDGSKAAEAARAHGIPRTHASYEALLADPDVDAIYNPLPNHLHVPWSERAAAAGKHVLCEKPIATSAAEARRLIEARDRARVVICEAAMVRLQPRWHAARELIRAGRIGELRAFIGTFGYALATRSDIRYEPSMGGGVLYDTGFYPVTMSRFCFEAEPVAVLARSVLSGHDGVDVLSSALLEFPRRAGHAHLRDGARADAARAAARDRGDTSTSPRLDAARRSPVGADAGDEPRPRAPGRRTPDVRGRRSVRAAGRRVRARRRRRRPGARPARGLGEERGGARGAGALDRSGRWETPEA